MRDPSRVVALSAAAGAIVGGLSPRPLYSVEIAQVMAGAIVLPANAPMAIHHGHVYSLVVDLAAVLLRAGLDVETVCRLMTMVMGTLSFAALSMAGYVFTRNPAVAALTPFAMFGYRLGGDAHRYPIGLPVTGGDLGANGLTAAVLTLGLIAARSPWGAVLLGLMPGIHLSWSVALSLMVTAGACLDRSMRGFLRQRWPWLAAGLATVVMGWVLHRALAPVFPEGPEINVELVRGFERYWDSHRRPIGVEFGTFISMFAADAMFIVLAVVALRGGFARRRGVRFWLIGAIAITVPSLLNSILDEFRPGSLPLTLSALMMSRWLNINTVTLPALATGLVLYPLTPQSRRRFVSTGVAAALAVTAMMPIATAWSTREFAFDRDVFPPGDRALLAGVRERTGLMLVVSPFEFAQLHTGRPQLLDVPLLDVLPYAPRAGVPMERILNDVYGASLLTPQPGEEQLAGLETRWTERTVDKWRETRRRYGVTEVMVPAGWRLLLPPIQMSENVAVYAIPEP